MDNKPTDCLPTAVRWQLAHTNVPPFHIHERHNSISGIHPHHSRDAGSVCSPAGFNDGGRRTVPVCSPWLRRWRPETPCSATVQSYPYPPLRRPCPPLRDPLHALAIPGHAAHTATINHKEQPTNRWTCSCCRSLSVSSIDSTGSALEARRFLWCPVASTSREEQAIRRAYTST